MSDKKFGKDEIVSFNETTSDVSTMLELDDAQLAQVVGGAALQDTCGELTSCNINGDTCPKLQSCGWNLWNPPEPEPM